MSELLSAMLAFPTVIFTVLLGVVVTYWIFVILGALDIDMLEFDVDTDVDADVDVDGDGDYDSGLAGVWNALGLGGVPVTLSLSLLVLAAWVFCLLTLELLGSGTARWFAGTAALLCLGVAVPVTALLVRPLRRFFVTHPALDHKSLVGRICTIATLRVDERYGQAEIEDGGAGLLIQVRSTAPHELRRGDRALIFDYKGEVFHVAPLGAALERGLEGLG